MRDRTRDYMALKQIIAPIMPHDRPMLRQEAKWLKQKGGEAWAVGEMLERACIYLDAMNSEMEDAATQPE